MLVRCDNRTALTRIFLLFIFVGIIFLSHALSYSDEVTQPGSMQFERANADTIKTYTRQILSEHDFFPRKTFWQWLSEKFSKWDKPKLNLNPGFTKFVLWIITIWCVLTLIAILIHFLWTVRILIKSNVDSKAASSGIDSESVKAISFKELYRMAQELAKNGEFHKAISVMIVALLKRLDSIGIVRFHESKTNGDYVREYPHNDASRNDFKTFVLMFEQAIYGGLRSDERIYQQMNSLMEHIYNSVKQKT